MSALQEENFRDACVNDTDRTASYVGEVVRFSVGIVSTLSCLLLIIVLFCYKLHFHFSYRLIIYWLASNVLIPFVYVVSLPIAWYRSEMVQFCKAIAALVVYSQWVLIITTLLIALMIVSMAVCSVQPKIFVEILCVLIALLLPLAFFWVPLVTKTYGYNSHRQCWIIEMDKNCNQTEKGYLEKLLLLYIPVLFQSLLLCVMFVTTIFALALHWCKEKQLYSSDEMESLLPSRSSHYTALKDTVLLFGYPMIAVALVFVPSSVAIFVVKPGHSFWFHTVVSTTAPVSGIVAASSVAIHLIVHKKKGRIVGTCGWCWSRTTTEQMTSGVADRDWKHGTTINSSCPTKFEPSTESEVDSALLENAARRHQV